MENSQPTSEVDLGRRRLIVQRRSTERFPMMENPIKPKRRQLRPLKKARKRKISFRIYTQPPFCVSGKRELVRMALWARHVVACAGDATLLVRFAMRLCAERALAYFHCPYCAAVVSLSLSVRLGKYLVKRKFSKKFYFLLHYLTQSH